MYEIRGISSKISNRFIEELSRFTIHEDGNLINKVADDIKKEIAIEPKGNPASH